MLTLRKLRRTLRRRKKPSELYTYTPFEGKNGYMVEYQHPHYTQVFHYKYKDNSDGTLTKYGYLLTTENWKKEKDCVFYQTVADKEQIQLERGWMENLRSQGRICIGAHAVNNEWREVMQHNNRLSITDGIQQRRLQEVFTKVSTEYGQRQQMRDAYDSPRSDDDEGFLPPSPNPHSYSFTQNSLLNISGRGGPNGVKRVLNKQAQIDRPKFSERPPRMHTYDPEESLVYRECRCEYCMVGDYNE